MFPIKFKLINCIKYNYNVNYVMQKNKIVHIISSLKIGGAESWLYDLVRSLNSFEHHVIYFYDGPNVERIKKLGIGTYQIKGLFFKYDPVFFLRCFLLIRKLNPDIIHSSLWSANIIGRIIAWLLKIPNICVLHLAKNFESSAKNEIFRTFLDRITISIPDKLVAVSKSMADELQKTHKWIPANKLSIIKNGIDVSYIINEGLMSNKKRSDFALTDKNFVIGNVGRLVTRKKQEMLMEAFALIHNKFPEMRLMLIGRGPMELLLKAKANNLNISDKVIFSWDNQAFGYYNLFDCFVLPSDQEGLSIALLEAMSFGLPCIVASTENSHEVISSGENGFIIKSNDKNELAQVLEFLYKNKGLREKIGLEARNIVKNDFSLDNMVKKYDNIFNDLLHKNGI